MKFLLFITLLNFSFSIDAMMRPLLQKNIFTSSCCAIRMSTQIRGFETKTDESKRIQDLEERIINLKREELCAQEYYLKKINLLKEIEDLIKKIDTKNDRLEGSVTLGAMVVVIMGFAELCTSM